MNRVHKPLAAVAAVALAATAAALGALPASQAAPAPWAMSTAWAEVQAQQAFRTRRYAEAYGRYAALADEGHAPSAWMALMLVTNGPAMFGGEWSATPGQLQRWSALATRHAQQRSALIPVHDRGE